MDALLMCGGRGSRLDAEAEKPLYPVGGVPMVDRVRAALTADGSGVDRVVAVTSGRAPDTDEHLRSHAGEDLRVLEAPGEGYVADLSFALDRAPVDPPVLTVAADLPLLAPGAVRAVLDAHEGGSTTVAVPVALKRLLGVSVDDGVAFEADGPDGPRRVVPAGINVVGPDDDEERTHVTHDARLAANVNRVGDARIAEVLL